MFFGPFGLIHQWLEIRRLRCRPTSSFFVLPALQGFLPSVQSSFFVAGVLTGTRGARSACLSNAKHLFMPRVSVGRTSLIGGASFCQRRSTDLDLLRHRSGLPKSARCVA